VAGSCGHGNELCDSIKGGESSEYLSDWQLLKKDSAPWTSLVVLYYCLEQTMDRLLLGCHLLMGREII
jgi:hypothetical protein